MKKMKIGIENPKKDEQLKVLENFDQINTGQTLMIFETPVEMINRLNEVYDEDGPTNLTDENFVLHPFTKNIFLDDDEKDNYNFIPDYIHEWIKDRIHQYLNFVKISYMGIKPTHAWINDMEAHEYNEIHKHTGGLTGLENKVGLTTLIGLKIPEKMEKESKDSYHLERDGWTEFISAAAGHQFVYPSTLIKLQEGMCVIFPYDVLHQVYPHFSNQKRRTMTMNVDVFF